MDTGRRVNLLRPNPQAVNFQSCDRVSACPVTWVPVSGARGRMCAPPIGGRAFAHLTVRCRDRAVVLYLYFKPRTSGSRCKAAVMQVVCYHSVVAQSCPTLCNPMDCSLPGSSIHGIHQARILEWVVISFSRRSSPPRDRTRVFCIANRFFASEPPRKPWV